MPPVSRTIDYGQVGTMVQDYIMPNIRDQIFFTNPIYYRMRGKAKRYSGGRAIGVPLSFDKEGGGIQWWAGADKLDTRARDPFTTAFYYRKNATVNITLLRDEEDSVNGTEAMFMLSAQKVDLAKTTIVDGVGSAIFNNGTDPKQIGGLAAMVRPDPTATHTYGGISVSTTSNVWWQNRADATAYTTGLGGTFAVGRGFGPIGKMWANIGRASGKRPTVILSNWGAYQDFHDSLVTNERYPRPQQDSELAKAGFENVMYRSAMWVVDERSPHDVNDVEPVYFLHEPALKLVIHTKRDMSFDNWKEAIDQKCRIAWIDWAGELTCSERRCHGVISAVDTTPTS